MTVQLLLSLANIARASYVGVNHLSCVPILVVRLPPHQQWMGSIAEIG